MNGELDIEPYSPEAGLSLGYEIDFRIAVEVHDNRIIVAANTAGLVTLARALLTLAQDAVPLGNYFDFDGWSGLEAGSNSMSFIKSIKLSKTDG